MKNWSTRIYDALIWARLKIVWENEVQAQERIEDLTHDFKQRLPFHLAAMPDVPGMSDKQKARWLINRHLTGDLRRYSEECKIIIREEALDAVRQTYQATKAAILGRTLPKVQEAAYHHTQGGIPDDHVSDHIYNAIPWQDIPESEYRKIVHQKFLNTSLEAWGESLSTKSLPKMADAFVQSLMLGESMDQVAERLMNEFGFLERSAIMIGRTAIQAAANKMQGKIYQANDDIIESLVFTATLDFATCPVCGGYDNQEYPVNGSKPYIPVHPGCRCNYAPRMKSFKKMGLGPLQIPDQRERESMDGLVPGTKSYENWINQSNIKDRFEAYKTKQNQKAYARKKARDAKRARDEKKLAKAGV